MIRITLSSSSFVVQRGLAFKKRVPSSSRRYSQMDSFADLLSKMPCKVPATSKGRGEFSITAYMPLSPQRCCFDIMRGTPHPAHLLRSVIRYLLSPEFIGPKAVHNNISSLPDDTLKSVYHIMVIILTPTH